MTIMMKTSIASQKQPADVIVMPLIEIEEPERPVNRTRKLPPTPPPQPRSRQQTSCRMIVLLLLLVCVLTLLAFTGGVVVLSDVVKSNLRYQGSCAITSSKDKDYVVLKEAPATASWFGVPTAEMKVYSSASDLISARILNNLLEDMSIEDEIESIYVHDGPRSFKVVHDFNENYTNIISPQRCFLMDMIRQFVLEPSSLIASFRNDSSLDLSHAHTVFKAELPDASVSLVAPGLRYPSVARPCYADAKPVYRLSLEGTHVLHKRSVEIRAAASTTTESPVAEPRSTELAKNDFVQFSGKHLQRITISNLDDVIKYEQDNNRLHAHPKVRAGQASEE